MAPTSRAAITLFVITLLIYLVPFAYNLFYKPFFTNEAAIDVVPAALLPISFLEQGEFYLDPFSDFINSNYHDPFFAVKTNNHLVSRYPAAAPTLALPFYGIPLGLGWLRAPRFDWLAYPKSALFTARIPAAFISALAVAVFLYCARKLTDLRTSATLAIVFAFGTSIWTTASQALWQHTPGILLLLIGIWFVLRGERGGAMAVAPGAFFISAAVAARASNIFAALALTGYVIFRHRRAMLAWILWAIPPVMLFVLYNFIYNGSIFVFGYQEGFVQSMALIRLDGLLGLFLSPSRGLLIYSPFFVFAFTAFKESFSKYRGFYSLALFVFTLNVFVISMFKNWDGGWGYGTRLLVDALPFAMLLLIPAVQQLCGFSRVVFFVLVAFAVGLQVLGLWDYGEHWHWHWDNYNYNVWDVAESEPLYYFKQYGEMALRFVSRLRM